MNLCRSGRHDKDVVGTRRQSRGPGKFTNMCNGCAQEKNARQNAARKAARPARRPSWECPRGHDKREVGVTKDRQCKECKNQTNREYNRRKKRAGGVYVPVAQATRPTGPDGFEDEYGPVPDFVPNSEWYDEVIVVRALTGYPTGRRPYKLEQAEIVRRMVGKDQAEIAHWCGVSESTMSEWVAKHG